MAVKKIVSNGSSTAERVRDEAGLPSLSLYRNTPALQAYLIFSLAGPVVLLLLQPRRTTMPAPDSINRGGDSSIVLIISGLSESAVCFEMYLFHTIRCNIAIPFAWNDGTLLFLNYADRVP